MKGGGAMKGKLLGLSLLAVAAAVLQGAEQHPLRLDVKGQPEGAKVFVDGTQHGTLPSCTVILYEPGHHLLHVEAPFHRPFDECVWLDKSDPVASKTVHLKRDRGLLLVKTDPAGATVTCRGSSLGITPLLITTLPCGQDQVHRLELSLNGYKKKRIDVPMTSRTPCVREEKLVLDSGILDCATEPAGATVLVNGIEQGKTPVAVMIPREGAKLTFRLEGFKDVERSVDGMSAGDRKTLDLIKLEGLPARLSVVTEPDKAKVYLDGKFQGMSPVTGVTAASGEHEIRVELSGYAPATRKVRLENGGDTTVPFKMENILGRIEVVTTPAGAKIYLDGKLVGSTRPQGDSGLSHILLLENVVAGEHAVLAHLDGYFDQSLKVTVRAKETKQLPFTLKPNFTPDTEVEMIHGEPPVKGLFKRLDSKNLFLEMPNGTERPIPRENIRRATDLKTGFDLLSPGAGVRPVADPAK